MRTFPVTVQMRVPLIFLFCVASLTVTLVKGDPDDARKKLTFTCQAYKEGEGITASVGATVECCQKAKGQCKKLKYKSKHVTACLTEFGGEDDKKMFNFLGECCQQQDGSEVSQRLLYPYKIVGDC